MSRFVPFALFFLVSTSLMGIFVIAALSMGMGTARPIITAAAIGFALALPVTWFVTKQIS